MASSRYDFGVTTISHKGAKVTTSVGSPMDNFIRDLDDSYTFEVGTIPVEHGIRPDLTSFLFYDTVSRWWLLLQYNNINDPFEGYTAGTTVKIPNI
jgi:hypothetical protein